MGGLKVSEHQNDAKGGRNQYMTDPLVEQYILGRCICFASNKFSDLVGLLGCRINRAFVKMNSRNDDAQRHNLMK